MSSDGEYILIYPIVNANRKEQLESDMEWLRSEYGGDFQIFGYQNLYWGKPKYRLHEDELALLLAERILESVDFQMWKVVKNT